MSKIDELELKKAKTPSSFVTLMIPAVSFGKIDAKSQHWV